MRGPLAIFILMLAACSRQERVVVVYTSQDQVYAERIFKNYQKQTGVKVLPVFDSESVKTAGLVQRLLAEKSNPRADVFWSNEEMLSRRLVDARVLDSNKWMRAGYRARRMIVNTNKVAIKDAPKSLLDLTSAKWSGKVAMAYPIYGTTAAHLVALRQLWGDEKWRGWCEGLAANKPFVVDGNSLVVRLVGAGEAWIGLTDSDDVAAGLRNGLPIASVPVASVPITEEFLRIPNTFGILKGAPHAREAQLFFDYVTSQITLESLVQAKALEGHVSNFGLELKYPAPVEESLEILKKIFVRT